ncbi:ferritin-like domain-containing protein [Pedobacter changchengzhani]|uniref:Ferritin-like domain-containing protein n=1 Tax=Pedobacter changchengzhani TaxID=2529274 RepID=A0A4R5MML6_9SPHI|nr:ferritin-like domain-containing protein [Pedobacter changchengzhani]TDG36924.1 ferritin-like domain-containing protein [Pedobacter changchengzhani]
MNILNILEEIEKVDGEIYERLSPRRNAMKDFFNMGKKISLAALPLAMGSMFQKAYGQTNPSSVTDVLNFALALEYLEFNFYDRALSVANSTYIPTGAPRNAITTIRDHEKAHVALFRGALKIATTDAPAYTYADYDFTAGGAFGDVDTNYSTFLKVALAFEDTGVRAFKGQATILKGMPVLTTALQVHSVEARHASHIRQMVSANVVGASGLKPWIAYTPNGNDTGVAGVNDSYKGEENTKQAGIEIIGINGFAGVTQTIAAESFDETLMGSDVKKIANLFIKTANKKFPVT